MKYTIFTWKLALPLVLLSAAWARIATAADPPFHHDKFDLMHCLDAKGNRHPVRA